MTLTTSPERALSDDRVARLSTVSSRRVIEPDEELPWGSLRPGPVLPDDLLSVRDLGLDLDEHVRVRLSREEVASMLATGIRFEAILTAGFALQIAAAEDLVDPRITYMLHEIGEESRHSRAFVRLIDELQPRARNPFEQGVGGWVGPRVARWIARQPALLMVLVLAGEEIPDLLQKRAIEHPDTDPLVAALNRYHRQEEARHLAFAHTVLPELWAAAPVRERRRVRHVAPRVIGLLFDMLVHPGVYAAVGLPGGATWRAVRRSPSRIALRHDATGPILRALLDAGVLEAGGVPAGWRRLCGVDRHGRPHAPEPTAATV